MRNQAQLKAETGKMLHNTDRAFLTLAGVAAWTAIVLAVAVFCH